MNTEFLKNIAKSVFSFLGSVLILPLIPLARLVYGKTEFEAFMNDARKTETKKAQKKEEKEKKRDEKNKDKNNNSEKEQKKDEKNTNKETDEKKQPDKEVVFNELHDFFKGISKQRLDAFGLKEESVASKVVHETEKTFFAEFEIDYKNFNSIQPKPELDIIIQHGKEKITERYEEDMCKELITDIALKDRFDELKKEFPNADQFYDSFLECVKFDCKQHFKENITMEMIDNIQSPKEISDWFDQNKQEEYFPYIEQLSKTYNMYEQEIVGGLEGLIDHFERQNPDLYETVIPKNELCSMIAEYEYDVLKRIDTSVEMDVEKLLEDERETVIATISDRIAEYMMEKDIEPEPEACYSEEDQELPEDYEEIVNAMHEEEYQQQVQQEEQSKVSEEQKQSEPQQDEQKESQERPKEFVSKEQGLSEKDWDYRSEIHEEAIQDMIDDMNKEAEISLGLEDEKFRYQMEILDDMRRYLDSQKTSDEINPCQPYPEGYEPERDDWEVRSIDEQIMENASYEQLAEEAVFNEYIENFDIPDDLGAPIFDGFSQDFSMDWDMEL